MGRSKLSATVRSLTLLASVGAPCLAHAADLLPPPPPPPPPVEIGGGWYLRGDVGVGAASISEFSAYTSGHKAPVLDGYKIDRASVTDYAFAGGGVGYQFNSFLRGDVTAEYRGGARIGASDSYGAYRTYVDADGNTHTDPAYNPDGSRYKHINRYNGNLSSVVVMANGYLDLGCWFGVTPFVGGGVGTAFHRVRDFHDTGFGASSGAFGTAKDRDTTSLAYAAHAGLAYDVAPNFKVEVAYRYLNTGSLKTGAVDCVNDPSCTKTYYKVKEVDSHDVKIGLRYLLGGVVAAPLPPLAPAYEPAPGPIVRKY